MWISAMFCFIEVSYIASCLRKKMEQAGHDQETNVEGHLIHRNVAIEGYRIIVWIGVWVNCQLFLAVLELWI